MIALLLSLFLLVGPTVPADAPYSSVQSAFKSGSASSLASMCKDKCLINILDEERVYSTSQATQVLKSFFEKNPPSSFSFIHKGSDSSEGAFGIGTYYSKGNEFRVTVHFKKISGSFKIESISIEN
ncbi:MAG: DUF4783 domain-containing protein [bacterium]|nr:DUF4783 domain-containing protein [bacterium]